MTQSQNKRYADRHDGRTPDPAIAETLKPFGDAGAVACKAAHDVATALNVPPLEIGITADLMNLQIVQCQMGLFGHGPDKKICAAAHVTDTLKTAITALTRDGRISCQACWEIADSAGMSRLAVAEACEALNLRIKPCQLGAF